MCAIPVVRLNYTVRWIQSKNTTINIAKWWCLLARKNYMFRPIAAIFIFWHFLHIIYNSLAENCQNLKMAAIGRNM